MYTLTIKTVGSQYCRGHRGRMVVGWIYKYMCNQYL